MINQMFQPKPEMSDVNNTPYDRYIIFVVDSGETSDILFHTSYFYFMKDAYDEYDVLINTFGQDNLVFVINETSETLQQSYDIAVGIREQFGPMPSPKAPEVRTWDIRDGAFPYVLFDEKGA
jgi:hypothetical protein